MSGRPYTVYLNSEQEQFVSKLVEKGDYKNIPKYLQTLVQRHLEYVISEEIANDLVRKGIDHKVEIDQ